VTAYGLGCDAPGPYTFTESIPHEGRTVAGHRSLLGKWLLIDGVGLRKVEDVGGAVGHGELDLYMTDCRAARRFGVQRLRAQVVSTH
jgi:3D (Asp-Asp-Asp) domain-containing protein